MKQCRWCLQTMQNNQTGHFCGYECAGAAAELPELVEKPNVYRVSKPTSKHRLRFFSAGMLVGVCFAWLLPTLPCASLLFAPIAPEPIEQMYQPIEIVEQVTPPPTIQKFEAIKIQVSDVQRGILTAAEIQMFIAMHSSEIEELYQNALLSTKHLEGTISLKIKIGFDGKVEWVSRLHGDLSPNLDPKVSLFLGKLRFPTSGINYASTYPGPTEATVKITFSN